jgi:hypothetical protein
MPQPVLAAEEEEEDNFTTMPNFRWENQSITDSAVQEQLIGTQYFVNNTNAGTGTQKFAKSRQLTSRDFYFESRFAIDIGTHLAQSEYWTDVKSNISDFEDWSEEDWNEGVGNDLFAVVNGSEFGGNGLWLKVRGEEELVTINATGLSVDATTYDWFSFEFRPFRQNITRIRIFDSGNNLLATDNNLYLKDVNYLFNEYIGGGSWTGTETEIRIELQCNDGVGFGGYNEASAYFNYTYLDTATWSEDDGFKFSLLNADDEEGMSFQFTRDNDLSYNISIDMYDAGGIALDYDYSFNYSIDVDGWLRIRVDWHLDKKKVKVLLEYDNGTDIINIRRITDLYGGNLGFPVLLLLEEGFPSLCINNSVGATARSLIYIDYIDADWNILEWREPSDSWEFEFLPATTVYQNDEANFTAISPYGCTMYEKSINDLSKWYQLSVDRFDGLSFEYKAHQEALENNDDTRFNFAVYNVHRNGSLEPIFRFYIWINPGSPDEIVHYIYVYSEDQSNPVISRTSSTVEECEGSISLYYESASKIIMQYKYSDANDDYQGTLTGRPIGEELFTKEMVFILSYKVGTDQGGASDDVLEFNIGGFELTRKDILGWIIGAILGPFFNLMGILFSPFIILFQLLTLTLVKAFKDLIVGLEPFFTMLGAIFGTIIDGLELVLKAAIEGIWSYLEDALVDIIGWLLLLADIIAELIIAIVEWIFPIISEVIQVLWGFIMAILTWVWEDFIVSTPLGFIIVLIVEAIAAAPEIFMGIINLFLFWQFWILIGIWIIVLPMQAAQCEGVSDFLERILGIFCIDVLPIELLGFGFWFPLAVPLLFWTGANIIVLA